MLTRMPDRFSRPSNSSCGAPADVARSRGGKAGDGSTGSGADLSSAGRWIGRIAVFDRSPSETPEKFSKPPKQMPEQTARWSVLSLELDASLELGDWNLELAAQIAVG